jgi:hypothetical protein
LTDVTVYEFVTCDYFCRQNGQNPFEGEMSL